MGSRLLGVGWRGGGQVAGGHGGGVKVSPREEEDDYHFYDKEVKWIDQMEVKDY